MKTVFIINPKAGHGNDVSKLTETIIYAAEKLKKDADIYITKAVGDARRFVKEFCETYGAAKFIACGGDGTFNEVLNGACEFEGAEIGVYPIGTGNDFCRNFKDKGNFDDISLQLIGDVVKCDAIKYTTWVNGTKKSGYSANMFNIGFDCNVADTTAEIKKKGILKGALAYFFSIFLMLVKKKGETLKIETDGVLKHDGELLLTSIANGSYCGGGIKSNPLAKVDDGFININIIKNVSRLKFIKLLPYYMKGTFLEIPNIEEIIVSDRCKKVTVTPLLEKFRICIDGEIEDAGKIEFEIVHNAFDFVVPSKVLLNV